MEEKGLTDTRFRIVVAPGLGLGEARGQERQDHQDDCGVISVLDSELSVKFMGVDKII